MEVHQEQVLAWRLRRQLLEKPGDEESQDLVGCVRRLCGVQAQVASAAALALGVRRDQPSADDIDQALRTDKTLVKMWSARGTLHLHDSTQAPIFAAAMGALRYWERASWLRGHGVTAAEQEAVTRAVDEVVRDRVLSRAELVDEVVERSSSRHLAKALRSGWGALLKPAAMLGLLCHGPANGVGITFTSPSTWLPDWRPADADEGGPEVVRAYLRAYGPATHDDFATWLARNTRPRVTKHWFRMIEDELTAVSVDGKHAWLLTEDLDELRHTRPSKAVRLLPAFDQYVIAVSRELIPAEHMREVSRTAGWISPVIVHGGRIAGVWQEEGETLRLHPFEQLGKRALGTEVERLGRILGVELHPVVHE